MQDWLAGEEAARCLLIVFRERSEVAGSGSGGDSGERHDCSTGWIRMLHARPMVLKSLCYTLLRAHGPSADM